MIPRRTSAAPGPAPSYEGDDRTDQDHNSGSHRENSNPLPDPALFSFVRRHVTSLMFFRASCRSQIPVATYRCRPCGSQSQSATTPPSGESRLEAHALGDLKGRDEAALDCLAGPADTLTDPPIFPPGLIEVGNTGRVPVAPIEAG